MVNRSFLYLLMLCSQLIGLPSAELSPQNLLPLKGANRPELTSALSPWRSKPSNLRLVDRQQGRSSLWPWLWLTSAAIVGMGSGAYVLRRHDGERGVQTLRQTVSEPSRPLAKPRAYSPRVQPNIVANVQRSTVQSASASALVSTAPKAAQASATYPLKPSPHHHHNLALASSPSNPAHSLDTLLQNLQSRDRAIRRQAIWELGQTGASVAVQPLLNSMRDADSQQRSLILAALSEIGARTLTPLNQALVISLQDKNADVRKNAIRDVTRIYIAMEQVSQLLGQAIADEDPEVRVTAQWALKQMRTSPTPELPALPTSVVHHPQ